MTLSSTQTPTLAEYLWPRPANPANMRSSILVCLGIILLTLSAKMQVALWPVPMTMQPLTVLLIGLTYGRRLALATIAAYLLTGALGLPVFAGTPERGIGMLYMMGPTGGFLFGFLVSVFITGTLAERGFDRSFWRAAIALAAGNAAIFLCGFLWLSFSLKWDPVLAWSMGVQPFLLGNALQSLLGLAIVPTVWKALHARG